MLNSSVSCCDVLWWTCDVLDAFEKITSMWVIIFPKSAIKDNRITSKDNIPASFGDFEELRQLTCFLSEKIY